MEMERQYLAALDLTHQMLSAASNQDWAALSGLERQRAEMIATIPPIRPKEFSLEPAMARRIAGILSEIENENIGIVDHVQTWQNHARILLRLDKPAVV